MKYTVILWLASASLAFGQVEMERLMRLKMDQRARMRADGAFDQFDNARLGAVGPTPCTDGKAGEYSCENVDMYGFLSHAQMGSATKEGNDVWGKSDHLMIQDLR